MKDRLLCQAELRLWLTYQGVREISWTEDFDARSVRFAFTRDDDVISMVVTDREWVEEDFIFDLFKEKFTEAVAQRD